MIGNEYAEESTEVYLSFRTGLELCCRDCLFVNVKDCRFFTSCMPQVV